MQITSYNPHLGLLRSEHCWGEHRTVYSGRSEADVVMASIRSLRLSKSLRSILAGPEPIAHTVTSPFIKVCYGDDPPQSWSNHCRSILGLYIALFSAGP